MRHLRLLAALASAATLGCHAGSTPAAPDGGSGPAATGPALATCSPTFGHTFITNAFSFDPPGQGFDLDHDGTVDNALGILGKLANSYYASSIAQGYALFLWDIGGIDAGVTDASGFPFSFFVGIDADNPPDASNNYGGMGQFLVPVEQLDVDCQPTTRFVDTLLQGGVLTGSASTFDIVAQAVGSVESNDDVVRATLAPDLSSLQGQLGGVASTCTLTILGSPIGSGSMLDLIVNNFVVEPDIDVDHNGGLDRVIGDGSRVTECIAADGTHIPGNVCGCDPRMHDGYSLAISFTAVPAQIVGIAGTP